MTLCSAFNGTEYCTLARGHAGDHVATIGPATDGGQELARWRCDHKFVDSAACLKCGWRPA